MKKIFMGIMKVLVRLITVVMVVIILVGGMLDFSRTAQSIYFASKSIQMCKNMNKIGAQLEKMEYLEAKENADNTIQMVLNSLEKNPNEWVQAYYNSNPLGRFILDCVPALFNLGIISIIISLTSLPIKWVRRHDQEAEA